MKAATAVLRQEHEAIVLALRILAEIDRHAIAHDQVHLADLRALVDFLSEFADTCHHGKEERLLFAQLTQTDEAQTRSVVERLLMEHEQGRHLIARMRRHLHAPFKPEAFHEAARAYTRLLLEHIDKENTVLLPMADRLLSTAQLVALSYAFERFELQVMGPQRHQALHGLLHQLQTRYSV